jgi:hypothetical protein
MKNAVRLEKHHSPWELERVIGRFLECYNHEQLQEAIGNVTPDKMVHGRQRASQKPVPPGNRPNQIGSAASR